MGYSFADLNKKKKKYSFADLTAEVEKEEKELDSTFTNNIAPVGGNKDSWFKSGSFSDGYQFGDVAETILGTAGDFAVGVAKGAGRMVEGLADLASYGIAGVADLVGADEFAEDAREAAQYSAVDEWTKPATDWLDQYSVLGNKADAISEAVGQISAIILTGGAAKAAAPAWGLNATKAATAATTAVTGLSSMGSGMSEAYAGGATDEEAATYGFIAGVSEAATELIFGGLGKTVGAVGLSKGMSSLDDQLAKKVSSKISNRLLKNFTEYGIKAGAEGTEEVISGFLQAVGKKVTYMSEEELGQLIKDENLLDSFIVGTVASGIAQSGVVPGMKKGSLIEANKEGTDFITGHTEIEQKVVDRVVAKTVAEREANGEKLSKKQLGEIEEAVERQLERGGISIDDIESALGGESYKGYKEAESKKASLTEKEKDLKKKVDRLLEVEEPTALDNAQYEKTTEQLKKVQGELGGIDTTSARTKASQEVFSIVSGDRNGKGSVLLESYREVGRRREAFTADLSTVDDKYRATYQRAMDSGAWNNTNKAHDFVDFVARQEAETGIQFDFTSTKKLAEAGYAVEGATINGVVMNGKIALNANSAKSLDTVVGHEITHVLEGTELYNALKDSIIQYAKTKGEYAKRKKAIEDLYANVQNSDVDIEAEVVADLVGDYLFTDEKFIKALSTNKNVFQRVFDEIKHLLNMVTAGSDEERQLLKVKRAFEKAYREMGAGAHGATIGTKYSLTSENIDSDGNTLSTEQQEYFKDSVIRDKDGNLMVVYHGSPSEFTEFKHSKIGSHGTSLGKGFYFTENEGLASGYYKEGGQLLKGYLDIKKPLVDGKKTIKRAELEKLIKAVCGVEANYLVDVDGYDTLTEALRDTFISNYVNTYEMPLASAYKEVTEMIYADCDTDSDIIGELINAGGGASRVLGQVRKVLGYDGVIFEHPDGVHEYVAFESNQFKQITNKTPTSNPDVRFSLAEETTKTNSEYGIANYTEEQYNSFGWVRGNDVVSKGYWSNFTRNYADAVYNKDFDRVTPNGEYMIEVYDERLPESSQVIDTIIFAKGEIENPTIARIIKIDEFDETRLTEKRNEIYEAEQRGIPQKTSRIFELYYPTDIGYQQYLSKESDLRDVRHNNQFGAERGASSGTATQAERGVFSQVRSKSVLPVETTFTDLTGTQRNVLRAGNDQYYVEDTHRSKYIFPTAQEAIDAENEYLIQHYARTNDKTVTWVRERLRTNPNFLTRKDRYSLSTNDIAPVGRYTGLAIEEDVAPTTEDTEGERIARVLTKEPVHVGKDKSYFNTFRTHFLDDASVFEDLALKTGNRELQAKFNYIKSADARAQYLIGNGAENVPSLQSIKDKVDAEGMPQEFSEYMYHKHNIDRMSLEARSLQEQKDRLQKIEENTKAINKANDDIAALGDELGSLSTKKAYMDKRRELKAKIKELKQKVARLSAVTNKLTKEAEAFVPAENKPVFGDEVTAEISEAKVAEMEARYPWMKDVAKEVYDYLHYTRELLVESGVISRETADLWDKMYPSYVPIRRAGKEGLNINVPLNTNRTTVNSHVKGARGGNADILPLFDTMADRTMQTYRAIAKNNFGIELKNTLNTTIETTDGALDIDDINSDEFLQPGKDGMNPTFTVFEDGKRVTFEITEDMHEAMKPTEAMWQGTSKIIGGINNLRRGLITEFNPAFMLTNPIKDVQDILMNSQHPAKTYANIPRAIKELKRGGKYATEYLRNGGEQNTYFDKQSKTFAEADKGVKKILGMPLGWISRANQFIERIPRLAEYIASRESGASIETAMLDAARVTTNFQAGGDITKWANRNGATFLNASVQGALQQVRNIREAKMNGLKGWLGLATRVAIAGLPILVLNNLLWDDDDEYEELSDYVKDNYYIVAKYGEGQFVRIPKGRTLAVIQDAFEQTQNALTGNDKVDFKNFFDLVKNNLAPNNPIENNIIAPVVQTAKNKTWYGEDLVPTRLQDLPKSEQYDESTDAISKWLGENLNLSPYKLNYLLDQYSGGIGDVVLPMLTPEAESGDNSLLGNFIAPVKDKFTTDSIMNNQNVTDFYDLKDELAKNANSSKATDEDKLKYKYINSVNSELSQLYSLKREIQNSNLSDTDKYNAIVEVQKQINSLTRDSLNAYSNVTINGDIAQVGDRYYRKNDEGEWVKVTKTQTEKANSVGTVVGGEYFTYVNALSEIKADTNALGKSITGSRKRKVVEYLNSIDIDYGAKLILYKTQYPSDNRYNYHIVEYLNGRDDITASQMEEILKQLGMTINENGRVGW